MKHLAVLLFILLVSVGSYAQSTGDILFSKAQDLQMDGINKKSKSILNSAIAKYAEAKKAYSSSKEKAKCDKQIQICRNNIKLIKPNPVPIHNQRPVVTNDSVAAQPEQDKVTDAKISLSTATLTFKATSVNEVETVEVECNYDDWSVESSEWIKCTRNDSKRLTICCLSENKESNPRIGSVKITCHNASAELTVTQDVKKIGIGGFKIKVKSKK